MMEQFCCDDISAVLSGLLDGELDGETQHLAEVHLAHCEKCRAVVNEAEELDAQVRSAIGVGESAWSDESARRVMFAIEEPGDEWKIVRRLRLSAWVGWGTAIAALMTLAFVLNFQNSTVNRGNGEAKLAVNDGVGGTDDVNKGLSDEVDKGTKEDEAVGDVNNGSDLSTKVAMGDGAGQDGVGDGDGAVSGGVGIDITGDFEGVSGRLVSFVPDFGPADAALANVVDDVDGGVGDRVAMGGDNEVKQARKPMETGVKDDGVVDEELGNGTDDVLYSAAVLLRALEGADDDSFEDVVEINQAIESDDLLDRLAASRQDVWDDDAEVIDQAWAALEWVSGPVDQGQLRQVQAMIANEDLAGRLERMSGEYGTY